MPPDEPARGDGAAAGGTVGGRVRRFREDRGLSLSQLVLPILALLLLLGSLVCPIRGVIGPSALPNYQQRTEAN